MIVTLPWPPRELHPNARVHWRTRAKAAQICRLGACYLAQVAGARALRWPNARLTITFQPPDKRRRDLDGMLSALKSSLDGIADATGIDDSRWQLAIARGEPVKGGAVVVDIAPVGGFESIGDVAKRLVERAEMRAK